MVDLILHAVGPIAVSIDWVAHPPAQRLGVSTTATWLLGSLGYVAAVSCIFVACALTLHVLTNRLVSHTGT